MSSMFDRRIKRLEQGAERLASRMELRKPMDHKQFARVIWYMVYNPRPDDTEAKVRSRERFIYKIMLGPEYVELEWTEEDLFGWESDADESLPET
jgi:hypothetical protein